MATIAALLSEAVLSEIRLSEIRPSEISAICSENGAGTLSDLSLPDLSVSESPLLDRQLLLAHVLGRTRTYLYTWPEKPVTAEQESQYRRLLAQRIHGVPVAYLLETQEFWSLPFKVSAATLIPRADTETLIETALALPLLPKATVLDLGTGTGAIALALASERPQWQILAVDKSAEAVALAKENVQTLGLSQVRCLQSDWFTAVTGVFDLIVSNPPYIAEDDPHLHEGDVSFEPASALVAGHDGLSDLRKIIVEAQEYLVPAGYLLVEHGWQQGGEVANLLAAADYNNISTINDLAGRARATLAAKAKAN